MKKLLLLLTLSTVTFQNASAALSSDLMLQGTIQPEISVEFMPANNLALNLYSTAEQAVGTFQMKSNSATGYEVSFASMNHSPAGARLKREEGLVPSQDYVRYNLMIDSVPVNLTHQSIDFQSTSSVPYDSGLLAVAFDGSGAQEIPGVGGIIIAGIYKDTVTATIAAK